MNPIIFKKAILKTDDESKEGIFVVIKDPESIAFFNKINKSANCVLIPEKIFVPINEPVLFTNSSHLFEEILEKCEKSNMLELMSVLDLHTPFIDVGFFDKDSGFVINFYQPFQQNPRENLPVYITVRDVFTWINSWEMSIESKNKWIIAMINENPPDEIKNKLLSCSL